MSRDLLPEWLVALWRANKRDMPSDLSARFCRACGRELLPVESVDLCAGCEVL